MTADDFDWAGLVARTLHPLEVQIIEAMRWIERPLSAGDLAQLFDGDAPRASISRRLRRLVHLDAIKLHETATARAIPDIAYRLMQRDKS